MTPTCPCIPGSLHPPWLRSSFIVAMMLHIYCPPLPPHSLLCPEIQDTTQMPCVPGSPGGINWGSPASSSWSQSQTGMEAHGGGQDSGYMAGRGVGNACLGINDRSGESSGGRGNGKRIFGKKVWFVGKTVGLITSCHGDGPPVGANVYPLERSVFRGPFLTPCLPETMWLRRHCLHSTQRSEIGSKFRVVVFSVLPLDGNTGYNLT